ESPRRQGGAPAGDGGRGEAPPPIAIQGPAAGSGGKGRRSSAVAIDTALPFTTAAVTGPISTSAARGGSISGNPASSTRLSSFVIKTASLGARLPSGIRYAGPRYSRVTRTYPSSAARIADATIGGRIRSFARGSDRQSSSSLRARSSGMSSRKSQTLPSGPRPMNNRGGFPLRLHGRRRDTIRPSASQLKRVAVWILINRSSDSGVKFRPSTDSLS